MGWGVFYHLSMKLNLIKMAFGVSALFLTACSSFNATYEPFDESRRLGYEEAKLGASDNAWSVKFHGNMFTEPTDIVLLAELRAVEICQKSGKALTRFLKMDELSPAKSIQSSEGFYKFVPPYLKNDVSTKSPGNSFEVSNGSNDPVYEVIFSCVDQAFSAQVQLREIAPEDAKTVVQDLRGVLQVDSFEAETNGKALQVDDFIIKANALRVRNKVDFYRVLDASSNSQAKLSVIRERKNIDVDAQLTNISAAVKTFAQKVVATACRKEEMKAVSICIH